MCSLEINPFILSIHEFNCNLYLYDDDTIFFSLNFSCFSGVCFWKHVTDGKSMANLAE